MTHSDEVTLNSGPIHIPTVNQGPNNNDRLVITIKNNSDRTLQADVTVDACIPGPAAQPALPRTRNIVETTLQSFPRIDIPSQSCQVYEVPIVVNSRLFIKVISRGDYEVIDGIPAGGKLEISVVAGTGQGAATGLAFSDGTTFVPYGSWVVEDNDNDDDDDDD